MSSIQYSEVFCENAKSQYSEFDICDFIIVGEGRDLIANSIRIEGDLRVNRTGNTRAGSGNQDDRIRFNSNVGIHGVVESISCEAENMGVIQRLDNYARLVNMGVLASKDRNDLNNSKDLVELRSPNERFSEQYCRGVTPLNDTNNAVAQDVDFSFMPEFCLNKMSGGNLSLDKTGYIKVSITLARVVAFLYGIGVDNNVNYHLSNLRLSYKTVPAGPSTPVSMRSSVNIKHSINSALSNSSAKVPAVADACSISFLQQNKENSFIDDNYACEELPQIDELQFLFNDTSTFIRYVINDKGDMLSKYLESFGGGVHNGVNADKFKSNKAFGLGVNFNKFVDLSNQKFTTQIKTANTNINNNPMIMFAYFHSVIQM